MTSDIDTVLEESDLGSDFYLTQGHCVSIAVALHEVFDSDHYVTVSHVPNEGYVDHATVRVDGHLYDGRGRILFDSLIEQFVPDEHFTEVGEHIHYPTTLLDDPMYDEEVKEEAVKRLLAILNEV